MRGSSGKPNYCFGSRVSSVALNLFLTAISSIGRGIADATARFVDPSMTGDDHARQARLAAVMLTAPFFVGVVSCLVAAATGKIDHALGAMAAAFLLASMSVVALRLRVRWTSLFGLGLAAMSVFLGWVLAGAGAVASPLLLLTLALPFEAWWIGRNRDALGAGLFAAAAVIGLQLFVHVVAPTDTENGAASFAIWHWGVALAYVAIAAPRLLDIMSKPARREAAVVSLEDVIDGAVLRLDADGQVIDAGGKVDGLIGVKPALLLGESFFERVHVGDRVAYLQTACDARSAGRPMQVELRIRVAREGEAHPVYGTFCAEFYPAEPMLLLLRINGGAEAMKRENARLRDQLAQAEIAKATFLATVSHELRTPLNSIIGFADMLAFEIAGKLPDPRQREYAALIRDSGGHLLSVVNAILDISRIESRAYPVVCEPFAFADAAAACHAMLAVQASAKSIELQNLSAPSIGLINADRRAVQQIMINLLSNAIKFTPAGGAVRLEARRNARTVTFEIHDNGVGMTAHDLERVGKPFVQAQSNYDRDHDGVGLGLSIAKGLIALHEGAMSISSAPGAGTCVSVTLPVDGPVIRAGTGTRSDTSEKGVANGPFRKSA